MLESLTLQEKLELQALLSERIRRDNQRKWLTYYPDNGPLRRELYPKHMQCFADGAQYQQRLFMAANRVGKTEGVGAYEVALHLTGNYPAWWKGRRFDRKTKDGRREIRVRPCAIFSSKAARSKNARGTGMIPGESIARIVPMPGVPDGVELVEVRSKHGGNSRLSFKSFDQGDCRFQGN